jgi:hypothetical protein
MVFPSFGAIHLCVIQRITAHNTYFSTCRFSPQINMRLAGNGELIFLKVPQGNPVIIWPYLLVARRLRGVVGRCALLLQREGKMR